MLSLADMLRMRGVRMALYAAEHWQELYDGPDRPDSLFEVGAMHTSKVVVHIIRSMHSSGRMHSSQGCPPCMLGSLLPVCVAL